MKSSKLIVAEELIRSKSKRPWACFETNGFSEEGLGIAMRWNPAFIKMLHENGIQGANEQETIQLFFLFMSSQVAAGVGGESDVVNPSGTPNLTSEANMFVR
jgi:hypothetical protein